MQTDFFTPGGIPLSEDNYPDSIDILQNLVEYAVDTDGNLNKATVKVMI